MVLGGNDKLTVIKNGDVVTEIFDKKFIDLKHKDGDAIIFIMSGEKDITVFRNGDIENTYWIK